MFGDSHGGTHCPKARHIQQVDGLIGAPILIPSLFRGHVRAAQRPHARFRQLVHQHPTPGLGAEHLAVIPLNVRQLRRLQPRHPVGQHGALQRLHVIRRVRHAAIASG